MFSTPFTSVSIAAATVSATTVALAPGYEAVIEIVGGTTSGYWATGNSTSATMPTKTMTIDNTVANTGRSTKKRASIVYFSVVAGATAGAVAAGGAVAASLAPGIGPSFGCTLAPSRTRCRPLTTTRSSAFSPDLTTRNCP